MKAKVKYLRVPMIVVQLGGEEEYNGEIRFVAEEEYCFLKSGFTGYICRIHESGPDNSSSMDHVGWDAIETAIRDAFRAGDDNMIAVNRVKLQELFKRAASVEFPLDELNIPEGD